VPDPANPVLAAFRDRFSHKPDINTFTPFGFFEAGYLSARAERDALRARLKRIRELIIDGDEYVQIVEAIESVLDKVPDR
jgi:hypothetical protein